MPKNIQKSLQDYISKIKKQAPHLQISHSSISHTTSKILSGCKHPKSLSFAFDSRKGRKDRDQHEHQSDEGAAATLEDIDNFLIENFKSLYGQDRRLSLDDHDGDFGFAREGKGEGKGKDKEKEEYIQNDGSESSSALYDSQRFFTPPPDLCGSHRFFVSPASSGSLLEEASMVGSGVGTSTTSDDVGSYSASMMDAMAHTRNHGKDDDTSAIPDGVEDCIAVLTVSPSPYEDFRRSMQEMLDARVHHSQRVDWDFMEELLFCYLRLNEKKQYRFILSAFVDLVVVLRQNSCNRGQDSGSGCSDGDNHDIKGKKRAGY